MAQTYRYIDMHCDTLMRVWENKKSTLYESPDAMADILHLREGGCGVQFFAIFMPPPAYTQDPRNGYPGDDSYIAALCRIFQNTENVHSDIFSPAEDRGQLTKNGRLGKLSGILTMEDGRAVAGDLNKLDDLYRMGIRVLGLTWMNPNCFGSPSSWDAAVMSRGLTDFGKEAVVRMNELNMGIDVSHLSDGGFWDVVHLSKQPFFATHSNCRALNPHHRSMSDDMIRALADGGGVMGVNFCPSFLSGNIEQQESTIDLIAAQLRHRIQIGGMECAAIGTDFDGISGSLEIATAAHMPLLFEGLEKRGFTCSELEHIAYINAERVLRDIF